MLDESLSLLLCGLSVLSLSGSPIRMACKRGYFVFCECVPFGLLKVKNTVMLPLVESVSVEALKNVALTYAIGQESFFFLVTFIKAVLCKLVKCCI